MVDEKVTPPPVKIGLRAKTVSQNGGPQSVMLLINVKKNSYP